MRLRSNVLPFESGSARSSGIKRLPIFLSVAFILAGILLFQTILFPYNPVHFGYYCVSGEYYTLISKDPRIEELGFSPDAVFSGIEFSHQMKFKSNVKILYCSKPSELVRFVPFLHLGKDVMGAAVTPDFIILTPKLKEQFSFMEKVMAHEASHSLLMQQSGLIRSRFLWGEMAWIPEGLAVLKSGWPDYRKGNYYDGQIALLLEKYRSNPDQLWPAVSSLSLPMRYYLYTDFSDFLIELGGEKRYRAFVKSILSNPRKWKQSFHTCYSRDFESAFIFYAYK